MKRNVLILVMLLMAATSFSQSSRRTVNSKGHASDEKNERQITRNTSGTRTSKPDIKSSGKSTYNHTKSDAHKTAVKTERRSDYTINNNKGRVSSADNRSHSQNTVQKRDDAVRNNGNNNPGNRRISTGNNDAVRNSGNSNPGNRRISTSNNDANYSGRHRTAVNNSVRSTGQVENRAVKYPSSRKYVESRPVRYVYKNPPRSREYRARYYSYRRPRRINIYWTNTMRHEYIRIYPVVKWWSYPIGYRIPTITAYDASFYTGEVMNVYGKIYEVFYSRGTDEYIAYFGAYYPYHDFTVVIPGWIARRYSYRPERYFEREHILVTGLITSYNGQPEIVVKTPGQIRIY